MGFQHSSFGHSDISGIENFANEGQPDVNNISGGVSGNSIHLFSNKPPRNRRRTNGRWIKTHAVWSTQTRNRIESGLDSNSIIFIGFSGNNTHYLEWNEE